VVEGELRSPTRAWSFPKAYGGLMTLGERIDSLTLVNLENKNVEVRRLAAGEYSSAEPASGFRYEVKLDPPSLSDDAAHISWLTADRGLLMLGDLLPVVAPDKSLASFPATVSLDLPELWRVSSGEKQTGGGQFEVSDSENAIFFVSRDLLQISSTVRGLRFNLVSTGAWAFSSKELLTQAENILESYADAVGSMPGESAVLILSPFPRPEGAQRWSAETRGSAVVLLSGLQPSKTAALVELSVPLTHELFHLWVPNGLALDGDYDWFYEGFTIYQAIRTGQRLNLLSFQDLLNAVARSFDTYSAVAQRDQLSLVEASQRRWTSSPSLIYQKGMLIAFIYDLTLRNTSRNKRSLDDVYKEIFRAHHRGMKTAIGNEVVINALSALPGMQSFANRYVQNPASIDLSQSLAGFGLQVEKIGLRTRISVAPSLSREQRDLLRRLGYNSETNRPGHK